MRLCTAGGPIDMFASEAGAKHRRGMSCGSLEAQEKFIANIAANLVRSAALFGVARRVR